ncbi:MAG: nicotinamide-nucleotide amidohydrolase family protein [Hyphomicrobiales bacterium]
MLDERLLGRATQTLNRCLEAKRMVATVESCTGGLIAASLTEISGSSAVVEAGFVTYSNEAKTQLVGVPSELIVSHGAVSKPVAIAMAEGALTRCRADIAVSVTGIAGPGGGSAEKPVGTVHMACVLTGAQTQHALKQYGDLSRAEIRVRTVLDALLLVESCLQDPAA